VWRELRRGLDDFSRRAVFEIEREHGSVTLDQLEDVGALVPADVQVCRRLARQRADGHEQRTLRVRELEFSWRLPVSSHAHGINRRDRSGKADRGDAVRRNRYGDHNPFVQGDPLDSLRWCGEGDGRGQQEDANW
jgi:hypothetical protein